MHSRRNSLPRWQAALLRLNRRQTHTLLAGVAAIVFLMMYPPWEHRFRNEIGAIRAVPAGFHFINAPPARSGDPNWAGASIRWTLLGAEFLLVGGLTAAFVYGFRDRDPMVRKLMRRYEPR